MQDQIYPCRLIYILNLMSYTVNADEEAGKKEFIARNYSDITASKKIISCSFSAS